MISRTDSLMQNSFKKWECQDLCAVINLCEGWLVFYTTNRGIIQGTIVSYEYEIIKESADTRRNITPLILFMWWYFCGSYFFRSWGTSMSTTKGWRKRFYRSHFGLISLLSNTTWNINCVAPFSPSTAGSKTRKWVIRECVRHRMHAVCLCVCVCGNNFLANIDSVHMCVSVQDFENKRDGDAGEGTSSQNEVRRKE